MFNVCLFFLWFISAYGDLTPFLQSDFGRKAKNDSVKNVDAIYLINLDKRPEKLQKTLLQFTPYGVHPYRFSAIDGLTLPLKTVDQLGVVYKKGMIKGKQVQHYFTNGFSRLPHPVILNDSFDGNCCFSPWNYTLGTLGCYLSHLSILKNAFDCGYQTIWVMEDDVCLKDNPHRVSSWIEKLDTLIGVDGWDVLYTEIDRGDIPFEAYKNKGTYFQENPPALWRPDISRVFDENYFGKRTVLNEDFVHIHHKTRTHSMIIRRSGIEKILNFANEKHIFYPYDNELALVPGLKMICLNKNLTGCFTECSDTQSLAYNPGFQWDSYKKKVLEKAKKECQFSNSLTTEKVLNFVYHFYPEVCCVVETQRGEGTYPIINALEFLGTGSLEVIYKEPQSRSPLTNLTRSFRIQPKLTEFEKKMHQNESLDFLLVNLSELDGVMDLLSKVKKGKYICILRSDEAHRQDEVDFLLSRWEWLEEQSDGKKCMFFKKPA